VPIHNQFFLDESNEPSPLALAVVGPTINVEIAVPTALAQQLSSAGQPIPPSHTGLAFPTDSDFDDRGRLSVTGCTLRTQGYIAPLGRNFLARVGFTYNGPGGFFTIAF